MAGNNIYVQGSYIDVHDNEVVNLSVDKAKVRLEESEERSSGMKELPKELCSKKAKRILDRAVEEGFLKENYQPGDNMEWWKMACMADKIGDELGLPNKWVVFCSFWGNKNLRKYKTDKEGLSDYKNFQKNLIRSVI